jgi:hypothetical protein
MKGPLVNTVGNMALSEWFCRCIFCSLPVEWSYTLVQGTGCFVEAELLFVLDSDLGMSLLQMFVIIHTARYITASHC